MATRGPSNPDPPLAEAHADALTLFAGGAPESAYAVLKAALFDRLHAEALNDLAVIAHEAGHEAEARAILTALLSIDPGNADARTNFGAIAGGSSEIAPPAVAPSAGERAEAGAQLRLIQDALETLTKATVGVLAGQQAQAQAQTEFRTDVTNSLRWIHAEEGWHRRHLRSRRASEDYVKAYTEPEPLISVVLPTYDKLDLLRSRAIPSILAQTYRNIEIVIVGDAAAYDEHDVTAGFEGAPIRFFNRPTRGPYPADAHRRWLVAGSPPLNDALALARGLWVAPFADDDAMRPGQLETLLRHAVENRLEFVYGKMKEHSEYADIVGEFPPRLGQIGYQAVIMHRALDAFEFELADADFKVPCDWAHAERLLRAGVRVGMVDEIVTDYYPSLRVRDGD